MFHKRKVLAILLAVSFFLTQIIATPVFAASNDAGRIAGDDRYKTAVAISQQGWETSEYAVLARGDAYADALTAGPLAAKYKAPILLTAPKQISKETLGELKRLGVKHLFIAGGTGAVSQAIENTLKAEGITSIERVYGANRYETAVKLAEKVGNNGKVVLATGNDYPDALSISVVAAKLGMPILLTSKDSMPASVSDYFNANSITQTYLVGGTGAIGSKLESSVPGPTRLAGKDRYQTNVEILKAFAGEFKFDTVYVALGGGPKGNEFADALTGAVLAAQTASPLVLVGKTLPNGTAEYLKTVTKESTKVIGLGGKGALASTVLDDVIAVAKAAGKGEGNNGSTSGSGSTGGGSAGGGGGGGGSSTETVAAVAIATTPTDVNGLDYDADPVTVSLSTSTSGAKIYYTTDGTNPTSSSPEYTVPFTVPNANGIAGGSYTVKAIGIKSGMYNSNIAQKTIVYNPANTVTVNSAAELTAALESNVGTIIFGGDIVGDVTAIRNGSPDLTVNFGSFAVTGNLSITADNVSSLTLNGTAVPAIDGNLTVSAAKATVNNGVNVSGTITVSDVGEHSWIENVDGNSITLTDPNGASIQIIGNPRDITVAEGANGLSITAESPVSIIVAPGATVSSITATAAGTTITNYGTVANVTAGADITLVNNNGTINVSGTGIVGVSGTAEAEITGAARTVKNITTLSISQNLKMGSSTTASIIGVTTEAGLSYKVTSANEQVVKVDDQAKLNITARAPGKAAITVQVKDAADEVIEQGTIFVTVLPEEISEAMVKIKTPVPGAAPETAAEIEEATKQSDYTVTNVIWNGEFTQKGQFKAGSVYTAKVTLTSKDNKAFGNVNKVDVSTQGEVTDIQTVGSTVGNRVTFTVKFPATAVLEQPVSAITVTGEGGAKTITTKGGTLQMKADVQPPEASNKAIIWSIAPEGIATINQNGLLTAVANGIVIVKATAEDGSGVVGQLQVTISGQEEISTGRELMFEVVPGNSVSESKVMVDNVVVKIDNNKILLPDGGVSFGLYLTPAEGKSLLRTEITGINGWGIGYAGERERTADEIGFSGTSITSDNPSIRLIYVNSPDIEYTFINSTPGSKGSKSVNIRIEAKDSVDNPINGITADSVSLILKDNANNDVWLPLSNYKNNHNPDYNIYGVKISNFDVDETDNILSFTLTFSDEGLTNPDNNKFSDIEDGEMVEFVASILRVLSVGQATLPEAPMEPQIISGIGVAARTAATNGDKIVLGNTTGSGQEYAVTVTGIDVMETVSSVPQGEGLWFGLQLSPEGISDITKLEYKTAIQSTFAAFTEADVIEAGAAGEIVWWINGDQEKSQDIWLKYANEDDETAIKLTVSFVPYEEPDLTEADVTDLDTLMRVLENTEIETINIKNDITNIDAPVKVKRKVTINGGGHTLSFTGLGSLDKAVTEDDGLIIFGEATVNNLKVDAGLGDVKGTWVGTYAIHVYGTKATLNDVTATGGNGGILVNGSEVTLTGTIDVSSNGFGGIEVSKGAIAELPNSTLTVTGTLVNTTESYTKPTIWLVNSQGTVTGIDSYTSNTTLNTNQTQYYKESANAEAPIVTEADVTDLDTLTTALGNAEIETINIIADISISESLTVGTGKTLIVASDKTVTVTEGGTLTVNGTLINNGTVGSESNYVQYIINEDAIVNGDGTFYGSMLVKGDGVSIEGVTINNKGDATGNTWNRAAVYAYTDSITIKDCTFNANEDLDEGICNAVVILPKTETAIYAIEGNTFNGYQTELSGFSSSGLLISGGVTKEFLGMETASVTAELTDEQDLAIINSNTFSNCTNDYQREFWAGSTLQIHSKSISYGSNLLLSSAADGANFYIAGDITRASDATLLAGSTLTVMGGKTLTIGKDATLTLVDGSLMINNGKVQVLGNLTISATEQMGGTSFYQIAKEGQLTFGTMPYIADNDEAIVKVDGAVEVAGNEAGGYTFNIPSDVIATVKNTNSSSYPQIYHHGAKDIINVDGKLVIDIDFANHGIIDIKADGTLAISSGKKIFAAPTNSTGEIRLADGSTLEKNEAGTIAGEGGDTIAAGNNYRWSGTAWTKIE